MAHQITKHAMRTSFLGYTIIVIAALYLAATADAAPAKKAEPAKGAEPAASATPPPKKEISCAADVTYTWKRTPQVAVKGSEKPKAGENGGPAVDEKLLEPVEIFYLHVEAGGATEDEGKRILATKLTQAQAEARTVCESAHQNQATCVENKLKSFGQVYNLYDFTVRSRVLNTITSDCARDLGLCLSTKASEVQCHEAVSAVPEATPEAAAAPAADAAKKGKK